MAFHIKNRETESLARKVATLKGSGLTQAVHEALSHELDRELAKPDLVEAAVSFVRDLQAKAGPKRAAADKAFRDSLYERD